ncbi:MAG: protein kinase [Planctomycetota bacterium]|nr:protein kinase [Planctomycetota bacterium]MDA1141514.1 protein kinase [Planctomycetota bacterium]
MPTVTCPHCRKQYNVSEPQLGQNARCGACSNVFQLKAPEPEALGVQDETRIPTGQEIRAADDDEDDSFYMATMGGDDTAVIHAGLEEPVAGQDDDEDTPFSDTSDYEATAAHIPDQKTLRPGEEGSTKSTESTVLPQQVKVAGPLFKPGEVILGLYSVIELIGEGGMGSVHRVHHRGWKIDMAVKSPRPAALADEKSRGLFQREAEAWVDLGLHPNIASCFYVREVGGFPCIFIEFVNGGSLRTWMKHGLIKGYERIIDMAIQICDGMAHAHRRGMIHRDLKPPNCLITRNGAVKITDFGLVKWATEAADGRVAGIDTLPKSRSDIPEATEEGLSGTPGYMAPEQWGRLRGEAEPAPVTKVTDIYAFGIQLYEMVCGLRPFNDLTTPLPVLRKRHREELPPDPSLQREDLPESLKRVIFKCLEKSPNDRYQSFEETREALAEVFNEVIGKPYPREAPSEAQLVADDMNNRALSVHDLGRVEESKIMLGRALSADPNHLEANYNRNLLEWRVGNQTDEEVSNHIQELCKSGTQGWRGSYMMGLIHMERRNAVEAAKTLQEACKNSDVPAYAWTAWGNALTGAGKYSEALNAYREAQVRKEHVEEVLKRAAVALVMAGETEKAMQLLRGKITDEIKNSFLFGGGRHIELKGHDGPIRGVALSHDGAWGASIGLEPDTTLRMWDFKKAECIEAVILPNVAFTAVAITADGSKVLAACNDHSLRMWDLQHRACLWSSEQVKWDLSFLSLASDGNQAITLSRTGRLTEWDMSDGRLIQSTKPVERVDHFASTGPKGMGIYSEGRSFYVIDLETGKGKRMPFAAMSITAVAISKDGNTGLVSTRENRIHVFDLHSETEVGVLKGHSSEIFSLEIDGAGNYCVSSSRDNTLRLWRISTGQCVLTSRAFAGNGAPLKLTQNGRYCLWGGWDKLLRFWVLGSDWPPAPLVPAEIVSSEDALQRQGEANKLQAVIKKHLASGKPTEAAQLVQKARVIPGYERDASIMNLWNECGLRGRRRPLRDGWRLRTIRADGPVTAAEFTTDSRQVMIGDALGQLTLWDIHKGEQVHQLVGHESVINAIVMKGKESIALTCSGIGRGGDTSARLWNLESGAQISVIECLQGVKAGAISPDGKLALLGTGEMLREAPVRLWSLETMQPVREFEAHNDPVTSVDFHPSGRWAISGSEDLTIRLWDLNSGECVRTYNGHQEVITSTCFRPDGNQFVSSSLDGTLRIWSTRTGKQLGLLKTDVAITSAVLSPDGQFLLLGGLEQNLQLWSMTTGKMLRSFEGHTKELKAIKFSPDGRYALSGSSDQTVLLWELDWDFEFPKAESLDNSIRPFLFNFLLLQCPADKATGIRSGTPLLDEQAFGRLVHEMRIRGFGWVPIDSLKQAVTSAMKTWKMPDIVGEKEGS